MLKTVDNHNPNMTGVFYLMIHKTEGDYRHLETYSKHEKEEYITCIKCLLWDFCTSKETSFRNY